VVKFGVRVCSWDTLPALNFVKIAWGICPLVGNFYQKFEIFAIFSYISSHFYTHDVKIVLKRTEGLKNPLTKQIFVKIAQGACWYCIRGDAYCFLIFTDFC